MACQLSASQRGVGAVCSSHLQVGAIPGGFLNWQVRFSDLSAAGEVWVDQDGDGLHDAINDVGDVLWRNVTPLNSHPLGVALQSSLSPILDPRSRDPGSRNPGSVVPGPSGATTLRLL